MFCRNCGSQIDDRAVVCPHCGVSTGVVHYNENYSENFSDRSNAIAIVGFVLSFFVAIAGLVCSIIGYKAAKNEGREHGGLALAGIIISAVSMVLSLIFTIIFFIFYKEILDWWLQYLEPAGYLVI